jgi:hypothetical protein
MFDGDDSKGKSFLPRKLPGGLSFLRRGLNRGNNMTESQINTKILIASVLTFSASFLVALAHVDAPKFMLYAYLFTLVNFAGYTFILNRTRVSDKTLPVSVVSAISAMLAGGFTASTALVFGSRLAVTNPRNVVAYVVLFVLVTLALLPEEAVDRIE